MTREEEIHHLLRGVFADERRRMRGYTAILFGSRARGNARARSDFDVGVIGAAPMPLDDFHHLADRLDGLPTLYRIDWVDLARADERFRRHALVGSKVLHEG
uniref:Nucleotidyltransferase domain-containing protein n=1 Tax=Candidatus Kentrum sp. TC TaxID=2126339 RepID=A0A450Z3I0_9GAMM|nr:MAG: Nucleotidyltransferase domain-containing protein [Candidatus Kentron sp. TC]VFK48341.1 MAG: Nucleotidyltransferase domain-containing protein [Candidatus Kentron sp. TC]VFK55657.1 MAG: Nucleotidyltransferase domain-containing protein [Candidatus Kentron sp. TC]